MKLVDSAPLGLLASSRGGDEQWSMKLYVGTSGYSHPEWKGSFYPEDLRAAEMLRHYAQQFNSCEINNTFHRMPTTAMLESWTDQVPEGFRFVLKASQGITHIRRLRDVDESVRYLYETAAVMKQRLGPIFYQLPPNLKKDAPRLRDFLVLLATQPHIKGTPSRAAFEFRHQSWFDDEVFELLRSHGAALCIADAEGELEVPFVATADWGYLRLRRQDYSAGDVRKWAKRVQEQKWGEAFVFFKHEEEVKGPELARQFVSYATKARAAPSQPGKEAWATAAEERAQESPSRRRTRGQRSGISDQDRPGP